MKWFEYLGNKISSIIISLIVLVGIYLLLDVSSVNTYTTFLIESIFIILMSYHFLRNFYERKAFYNKLGCFLFRLDKKYLITEMIDRPDFLEGQILFDSLQVITKSMNDEIGRYQLSSREYKEYIEMWIHEVKTPIASAKLTAENNKNAITNSIGEDIDRIEYFIEQALYYARSNTVSKDYFIKEIVLQELVNNIIRKNSRLFISRKVNLSLNHCDGIVYSDEKWLDYILNQIMINALKYTDSEKEQCYVKIYVEKNDHIINLSVEDNGIGISLADLPRITEKGFTGNSGRKYAKSTGMGLYLCKTLCNKMGLSLSVQSILGESTIVTISFPHS